MNKEELAKLIEENQEDELDFTGGVDENKIKSIEVGLQIELPNSYKWFLRTYGKGGVLGVDILGFGKIVPPSVTSQTEIYRKSGLPLEYVVIENCDEFLYCLDTSKMRDGECPVVFWDKVEKVRVERAENFIRFFAGRIMDSKEDEEG